MYGSIFLVGLYALPPGDHLLLGPSGGPKHGLHEAHDLQRVPQRPIVVQQHCVVVLGRTWAGETWGHTAHG